MDFFFFFCVCSFNLQSGPHISMIHKISIFFFLVHLQQHSNFLTNSMIDTSRLSSGLRGGEGLKKIETFFFSRIKFRIICTTRYELKRSGNRAGGPKGEVYLFLLLTIFVLNH